MMIPERTGYNGFTLECDRWIVDELNDIKNEELTKTKLYLDYTIFRDGYYLVPFRLFGATRGYVALDEEGVIKDIQFYKNCFDSKTRCYREGVMFARVNYIGKMDVSLLAEVKSMFE